MDNVTYLLQAKQIGCVFGVVEDEGLYDTLSGRQTGSSMWGFLTVVA